MFTFRFKNSIGPLLAIGMLLSLVACSEQATPPAESIRAIRSTTVFERASGKSRRFSGIVEAADTSSISFEVSGNVKELKADVGEKISQGQVLATLDTSTFLLNVEAAQAAVVTAEVELTHAERDLERLRRLILRAPGAVSERALDQAEASFDSAQQRVRYATSRLNLAKRDLDRTELRAPFDGVVAKSHVDRFQEVTRGKAIFDLFMKGVMQVAISVPESDIGQVYLGLAGEVRFPGVRGNLQRGIVTEISQVAGSANAFPVKLTIEATPEGAELRPGMTAEVSMLLDNEEGESSFLIPIGAILLGGADSGNSVFVFDSKTSTVRKTAISDEGIRGSSVVVTEGLNAGDIIASAGVSFLRDGQKVKLMER